MVKFVKKDLRTDSSSIIKEENFLRHDSVIVETVDTKPLRFIVCSFHNGSLKEKGENYCLTKHDILWEIYINYIKIGSFNVCIMNKRNKNFRAMTTVIRVNSFFKTCLLLFCEDFSTTLFFFHYLSTSTINRPKFDKKV